MREVTVADFLGDVTRDAGPGGCDVLVLALVGGTVQAMLHGLARAWDGAPRRPVVVTGYVGVVYEKMVDGLLLRAGADVVLANSAHDADRFRDVYTAVGANPDSVVETALPFIDGEPYRGPSVNRPFTVCFAVQPSAPAGRTDRLHLLSRVADHARRYPDRAVLVKLRSLPGEQTTHVEEHPYVKLAGNLGELPPNLEFVYGNMGEVLDRTDLCVTVSSTAALESMQRGMPTAILTDLGVREALGNHYFVGSGCLASWDQLDAGLLPTADARWLRRHGVTAASPRGSRTPYGADRGTTEAPASFAAARERVSALAAAELLPPLRPYYTPGVASGYLPRMLARHGLDLKGQPVENGFTDKDGASHRRIVRRAARELARWTYRTGVQRVAPVVRRWGQI